MNFTEFNLNENLQKGITETGYVTCTPVQEQVLKASLEGKDLYVQSQTGTGKTAAYLVSIIQELLTRENVKGKKALIMVPTRELAVQVQEEAEKLAKETTLTCESFYGGVGYDKQVAALKKGVDLIIGTPGRVIDLNEGKQMDLSDVAFLVIDEADRMFDMGFYPDLRTLIKVLPITEKRQTMLFSATLNSYVKNLAWEYTRDPEEITIAADNITVDEIDQELLHVSSDDKMKLLIGILTKESPESAIIFCNTKRMCEVVSKRLAINGIDSEFIIGDLPQSKRLQIMDNFKAGKIKCLVATDVAARGIDVNDLAMVINFDLPNEAENYVHRIGRTARAGKSGKAYTFCSEQDVYSLPAIERYVGKPIPSHVAEDSQMVEDKSAGTYIRTDDYHEDYEDHSEFGRRRAAEYAGSHHDSRGGRNGRGGNYRGSRDGRDGGRGEGRSSDGRRSSGGYRADRRGASGGEGTRYDPTRGRGRYSIRNEEASKEYRRDRRVYSPEEEAALANMSTDERMKLYKEKYAGKNASVKSSAQTGGNRNSRNNAKKVRTNERPVTVQNKKPAAKKQGLFGKIKSLFTKK